VEFVSPPARSPSSPPSPQAWSFGHAFQARGATFEAPTFFPAQSPQRCKHPIFFFLFPHFFRKSARAKPVPLLRFSFSSAYGSHSRLSHPFFPRCYDGFLSAAFLLISPHHTYLQRALTITSEVHPPPESRGSFQILDERIFLLPFLPPHEEELASRACRPS